VGKRGRPSVYTEELVEEICDRLADGEPLRHICRSDGMPSWRTVYDWLGQNEDFAARIARARELGEVAISEQCMEIADDEQHDWVMTKKGTVCNEVAVGRAKLQVWTRLQLLARWNPNKWGDRQKLEHSGTLSLEQLVASSMKPSDEPGGG
jgi:hypothetical protein